MAVDQNTVVRVIVAERAKLSAYIWSIVRDEHVVDDVLQEISVLAIEKCDQIDGERALLPWLRSAARFRALHAVDARKRLRFPMNEQLLDQLDHVWAEYDAKASLDLAGALRKCLARLSPYARQLIRMRYVEELSGTQIAESLQRSVNTVYTALSRAYRSLRECVQGRLKAEGGADG